MKDVNATISTVIAALLLRATAEHTAAGEAMHLTQAALNVAQLSHVLNEIKRREGQPVGKVPEGG